MPEILVNRKQAEKARIILRKEGLLDYSRKPLKKDDDVIFPVQDARKAVDLLLKNSITAQPVEIKLPIKKLLSSEAIRELALEKGCKHWSSYSQIGDILLLNIKNKDEIEDAKKFATLILTMFPRLKSAYAKCSTEGTYRTPRLIHLAGEKRTKTIVKEYGIKLAVDIAKAYYNPKLSAEHNRLARSVKDGETILDLFAGIGGFTLHIATRKNTIILANDINPIAIKLLLESINLNKKYIKSRIYSTVDNSTTLLDKLSGKIKFDRIIMNNPTMVNQFLPKIKNVVHDNSVIHVYTLIDNTEKNGYKTYLVKNLGFSNLLVKEPVRVLDYSPSKSIFRYDVIVN